MQGMTSYNVAHVEKAVLFDDADLQAGIDPPCDPGGSINNGLAPFPAAAAGIAGAPAALTEEALRLQSQLEGDVASVPLGLDSERPAEAAEAEDVGAQAVDPDAQRQWAAVGVDMPADGSEDGAGSGSGSGSSDESGDSGHEEAGER